MAIKFIIDSMCDSKSELLNRYDFDILPIPITLGDKTYSDGIDITPQMVIDFVDSHKKSFPKTAQIAPLDIINTLKNT